MAEKSGTVTKCLLVVVVVVVALLAVVAIIVAALSLGGNRSPSVNVTPPDTNTTGYTDSSTGGDDTDDVLANENEITPDEDKIWTIATGHDYGAQEYIDVDGYIRGFMMDLILEVCELGGMQCRTVWEPYINCYDSVPGQHSYGGKGLMGGWYDACSGWVKTVARTEIFDFSLPFLKGTKTYFWVKKGNRLDLPKAKSIGFLDGWSSDEKCVARTGREGTPLDESQVKHYLTTDQLTKAIKDGEVDAGFAVETALEGKGLERLDEGFMCMIDGNGMMTRKDNAFRDYWNKGFRAFKNNGGYRKLCEKSKETHGAEKHLLPCF